MSNFLAGAIHEMVWLMDKAADDILQDELGFGFDLGHILLVLRFEQPCSQRNLAAHLGVTPAAVTRSLPGYFATGFIHIEADPKQPRRNFLTLTKAGQQKADACWQLLGTEFKTLVQDVDVDGEGLLKDIERICAGLRMKNEAKKERR